MGNLLCLLYSTMRWDFYHISTLSVFAFLPLVPSIVAAFQHFPLTAVFAFYRIITFCVRTDILSHLFELYSVYLSSEIMRALGIVLEFYYAV